MAVAGLSMAGNGITQVSTATQSNGPRGRVSAAKRRNTRGWFRYPEQSSRQEMRIHRRAQGGPGIHLVTGPSGFAYYIHKPYFF